jgi:hypothetical protein
MMHLLSTNDGLIICKANGKLLHNLIYIYIYIYSLGVEDCKVALLPMKNLGLPLVAPY